MSISLYTLSIFVQHARNLDDTAARVYDEIAVAKLVSSSAVLMRFKNVTISHESEKNCSGKS